MDAWFTGSKEGLEKIARRRGLSYVLFELVQNAWDTGAKNVTVTFEPVEGRNRVWVSVEDDDPDGFTDLSHASTLFAESEKKGDPTKRGRFNFGEKLVLAVCEEAEVSSTKGRILFHSDGSTSKKKSLRDRGTLFRGMVKMTRLEMRDVITDSQLLIPPLNVQTRIVAPDVDRVLVARDPIASFETTLKTEIANEEGFLKEVDRKTRVNVYAPLEGESGKVYEMGIPVGWSEEIWDIDVQQKVPVNLDRNDVPLAYRRALRVLALNAAVNMLPAQEATGSIVQTAIGDPRVTKEVLDRVLTLQFGDNKAISDPSDREAERRLKAKGYTIIHGRSLAPEVFENIRRFESVLPAGQISPSYEPYSSDPGAKPATFIPEDQWTNGMKNIAAYATVLGSRLLGTTVAVRFESGRGRDPWAANFGKGLFGYELTFNYAKLGAAYFEGPPTESLNDLLIHEFAHMSGGHLSEAFDNALSRLGAKMVTLALCEPQLFQKF